MQHAAPTPQEMTRQVHELCRLAGSGFFVLCAMPAVQRYADIAQMFADCAAALQAFNAFGYGVQSQADVQDAGEMPLLFLDGFINFSITNGAKAYTVAFMCLTKTDDDGNLTYRGTMPTDHHICKSLAQMEWAGEQVIAWLNKQMNEGIYPFSVQEEGFSGSAVPIIQEFNGLLTGYRFEITLETSALNNYCDLKER